MWDKFGRDEEILEELREISNKYSPHKNDRIGGGCQDKKPRLLAALDEEDCSSESDDWRLVDENSEGNDFLTRTAENRNLNQYWYSRRSIDVLCDAVREGLTICHEDGGDRRVRAAFLSAPSLFFSLSPAERERCVLLEFDATWSSCRQFRHYDYNDPGNVDESLHGEFDVIFMDPPFISGSVWRKYAITAEILMRRRQDGHNKSDNNSTNGSSGGGNVDSVTTKDNGGEKNGNKCPAARIIAATVAANAPLMDELFGCSRAAFQPCIPGLVYQFSAFANFPSSALARANPELVDES